MADELVRSPGDLVEPRNRGLSLLVVIPCLNEEPTIGRVVAGVPREMPGVGRVEILVIDDGSTDRTAERAREAGAEVLRHPANLGLGTTFREAVQLAVARGVDVMVHIDGDGQFDPADIPTLVQPIVQQRAAMATASRFLDRELLPEMPAVKRWGNRWVARIVQILAGRRFFDVSCGFRAYSKEALLKMNLFGSFTYTQEVFLDLVFKELPVLELPVSVWGTREHGTSRVVASIPRYALRSLQIMLRAFISYRPFAFFAAIAAVFLVLGFSLLVFLGTHYLRSGAFTPHVWAGFGGGSCAILGRSTRVTGVVGDILVRMRRNQEDILYLLKSASWEHAHGAAPARTAADPPGPLRDRHPSADG